MDSALGANETAPVKQRHTMDSATILKICAAHEPHLFNSSIQHKAEHKVCHPPLTTAMKAMLIKIL